MKVLTLAFLLCLSCITSNAQQIDASFSFETDPNKKYSLYIPSTYDANTPNKLMIAFHPFNTSRWDALSWRDTLITFAENAGLILACPDGGTDGRVDDAIDYRFTTALIDSVKTWYNIDASEVFAMGFSVGGKATYEYGLNNPSLFSGFIPIGAAINGTSDVSGVLGNAKCKAFYLIHGEQDAPNTRYTPIKDALTQNKAEVNNILMAGVGHTIDFPNRNKVLKDAFNWIDTVKCKTPSGISQYENDKRFRIAPTLISSDSGMLTIYMDLDSPEVLSVEIWSIDGKQVFKKVDKYGQREFSLSIKGYLPGSYLIKIQATSSHFIEKFVVE